MAIEAPNSSPEWYSNPHFDSIYTAIWKILLVKSVYRREKKKSKKVGSYRTVPNHFSDWGVFDSFDELFHKLNSGEGCGIFPAPSFS